METAVNPIVGSFPSKGIPLFGYITPPALVTYIL